MNQSEDIKEAIATGQMVESPNRVWYPSSIVSLAASVYPRGHTTCVVIGQFLDSIPSTRLSAPSRQRLSLQAQYLAHFSHVIFAE